MESVRRDGVSLALIVWITCGSSVSTLVYFVSSSYTCLVS